MYFFLNKTWSPCSSLVFAFVLFFNIFILILEKLAYMSYPELNKKNLFFRGRRQATACCVPSYSLSSVKGKRWSDRKGEGIFLQENTKLLSSETQKEITVIETVN